MAQPYVGEIRMFAGNFAPAGWAICAGQLIPISENETLFNLIGTTYGGDGQNTFALPDLQGRIPIHQGTSVSGSTWVIGQKAGTEQITLNTNQIPQHSHAFMASQNNATLSTPANNVTGLVGATQIYRDATPSAAMAASAVTSVGGSLPHDNLQPFLCVSFIISLFGIFPTQT
jgi:microcystin-dependent protein